MFPENIVFNVEILGSVVRFIPNVFYVAWHYRGCFMDFMFQLFSIIYKNTTDLCVLILYLATLLIY